MKTNISLLVNLAYHAFADRTLQDRALILTQRITRRSTLYVYAYRDLVGNGAALDLMYESPSGASYDPIRYANGKIAYDFPASENLIKHTRAIYDYLLDHSLRAHSDFINIP